MARSEIEYLLGECPAWVRAGEALRRAFVGAMWKRQLQYEPCLDAFLWFAAGWQSHLIKS